MAEATLAQLTDVRNGHPQRVERDGENDGLEIAVAEHGALLDRDEWVVARRVQLDLDRSFAKRDELSQRPVHLRDDAKRQRVLH